ncbi:MAG: ParB/RepB/Spo0J family partition protein [Alphaproteobacteria bacterium]|nr:ParB/RepB/Spo0J family partition protein [Alphaproteobacteria bacterium]
MSNKTLGRGLSALLGDMDDYVAENNLQKSSNEISVNSLKPGKMQPRHYFNEEKMQTLVESVRQKGILQPLLVREIESGFYEIIAGERRWRAAKEAGLADIPVVIVTCNDREALELGLIENLQRDDLNPMEEAESLHKLLVEHQKTQEEIAFSISKSRSYVANMLRLMQLPEEVKNLLRAGKLSAGHARSILNSNNIEELAKRIVNERLSVRAAEHLVKKYKTPSMMGQPIIDPDAQALADRIGEAVGMKTKLQINRNGGMLTLYFQQFEQLDDLMNKLQN